MIDLRSAVNIKKIIETENPDKVVDIVEEIFNINKQWKTKRTLKQILQRLPVSLAQVHVGNTSKKPLN